MAELNFVSDSITEFFGTEDKLDTLLSSVDQQELDSVLQSSEAVVASAAQPDPLFATVTTGDLKCYKTKTGIKIQRNLLQHG